MTVKVTNQDFVDSVGPGEGLRRFPVEGYAGLYLQVTAAGVSSWVFRYRIRRDQKAYTIGQVVRDKITLAKAKTETIRLRGEVGAGRDPSEAQKKTREPKPAPVLPPPEPLIDLTPTLKDAAEAFYRDWVLVKNQPSTAKYQRWALDKYVLPALGGVKLPDVDIDMVSKFLDGLSRIPTTANRVRALLNKLFNWSLRRYNVYLKHTGNPVSGSEKNEETPREARLTDDQIRAIGDNYRWYGKDYKPSPGSVCELRHALMFLLLTGARSGVVLCETEENRVPAEKMLKFAPKTPGLKGCRAVYMCDAAVKLLPHIPYGIDRNQLWHAWEHLRPEGCDCSIHDLRRTFASIGVDLHHDEAVVDALLGHSRGRIRDTYHVRADATLLVVAEDIGSHIAVLLGLQKPKKQSDKKV
jgi:integrase